jgi:hypothetical protein
MPFKHASRRPVLYARQLPVDAVQVRLPLAPSVQQCQTLAPAVQERQPPPLVIQEGQPQPAVQAMNSGRWICRKNFRFTQQV